MAEDISTSTPPVEDTLVDLLAQVIGLELAPEHRPGVIANFQRTTTIAQLVMEFPLADDVEIAPIFQP